MGMASPIWRWLIRLKPRFCITQTGQQREVTDEGSFAAKVRFCNRFLSIFSTIGYLEWDWQSPIWRLPNGSSDNVSYIRNTPAAVEVLPQFLSPK